MRSSTRTRHSAEPKKKTVSLQSAKIERSYMCSILHQIPDEEMLRSVPQHKVLNYMPYWSTHANLKSSASTGRKLLAKGQVCLVSFLSDGKVGFYPLPTAVDPTSVNYGVGYDFTLAKPEYASRYVHIYGFSGFSIVSIPEHDFKASLRFYAQGDSAKALLFCDRAICNIASLNNNLLTEKTEKYYEKFLKLTHLWLDTPETHEGALALTRAMQLGSKCFTLLAQQGSK